MAGFALSHGEGKSAAALGLFALAWWVTGLGLRHADQRAVVIALALVALPWSLGVLQIIRRAAFVSREEGMEPADGTGSPLAFLLGITFEVVVVVIPLTIVGAYLWRAVRQEASRPAV